MPQPKLKIAIQKSGRLSENSLALFREGGIKFDNGQRKLRTLATNFPIEFLFFRNGDIPGYVADGIADLGIIGRNIFLEERKEIVELNLWDFQNVECPWQYLKMLIITGLNILIINV